MSDGKFGIYPAFVSDNNDPKKAGRIRVTSAEAFCNTTTVSAWCTPISPVGIENGGDFCVPEVDEGVYIMFLEGDVDRPVWLGGWWKDGNTPLGDEYSSPEATRVVNFKDNTMVMQEGNCNMTFGQIVLTFKDSVLKIKAKQDAQIQTVKLLLDDVEIVHNGKMTSSGDHTIGCTWNPTTESNEEGISFLQHQHLGVHGITSPPLGS